MGNLECLKKLTTLDEQREAVMSAMNQFVSTSNDLLKAFAAAASNTSDMALVDAVNHQLGQFNGVWFKLDDSVTTWDNTMRKFSREVLEPIRHRIKRDNTLKEIKTTCDSVVVYSEWSEGEVKILRGLLEVWRNYRDMVISFADEWGNTRVGY